MRATYDESVELADGRSGVVVAIGAQLTPPFARRYFVRLHGADALDEVSVAESEILRVIRQGPLLHAVECELQHAGGTRCTCGVGAPLHDPTGEIPLPHPGTPAYDAAAARLEVDRG